MAGIIKRVIAYLTNSFKQLILYHSLLVNRPDWISRVQESASCSYITLQQDSAHLGQDASQRCLPDSYGRNSLQAIGCGYQGIMVFCFVFIILISKL